MVENKTELRISGFPEIPVSNGYRQSPLPARKIGAGSCLLPFPFVLPFRQVLQSERKGSIHQSSRIQTQEVGRRSNGAETLCAKRRLYRKRTASAEIHPYILAWTEHYLKTLLNTSLPQQLEGKFPSFSCATKDYLYRASAAEQSVLQ
jgi:hypothetical protein